MFRALVLAMLLPVLGCEAALSLGSSCALSSECPAPLACVAGRCRSECDTVRDCPRGQICLSGEGGVRACEIASVDACTSTTECGARLVCLAGRCTNECTTDADCVAGARCDSAAGCVECLGDADCPLALRCGSRHTCEPECTTDADCVGGLVCRADRCVLAGDDAGPVDAPIAPVEADACDRPFVLPLGPAPEDIVVRVPTGAWTDGTPSCTPAPDAYLALELPGRALVTLQTLDASGSGIGLVDSCTSGITDCSEILFAGATFALPAGRSLFVQDRDTPTSSFDLEVLTLALGEGTPVTFFQNGDVDTTLTLDGAGTGACGSGASPDALFYTDQFASPVHLVADAPGVSLTWASLLEGIPSCGPTELDHSEITVEPDWRGIHALLIARDATGPVTVHVTGHVGP